MHSTTGMHSLLLAFGPLKYTMFHTHTHTLNLLYHQKLEMFMLKMKNMFSTKWKCATANRIVATRLLNIITYKQKYNSLQNLLQFVTSSSAKS